MSISKEEISRRSAARSNAPATSELIAALEVTRRPFAQARTLPGQCYVSPQIHAIELDALFGRMWVCVAREEDLAAPGDFLTREIGNERILLIRGGDGVARAFYNVCRHRGSRLVEEESGNGLERLRCRYHAWCYGLDGALTHAPNMGADFCKGDFPLAGLRLESFAGFLFVNLDEYAEPLAEYLAELPDMSRFRIGELRRGHREVYEIDANWKLVCENYSECYHCAGVHPQLFRISDYINGGQGNMQQARCFNGGPMQLREGFDTMSMTGHTKVPMIPGVPESERRKVYYYLVYPNMMLSPHPDYVLTHTVWPLGTGRSRIVCEWLFTEEAVSAPDFDPADMVEFWDVTNRQDWGLCERVQLGAASRGFRPGPYQPSENCVHAFDSWYAERLAEHL